jgi:hypothetical protein
METVLFSETLASTNQSTMRLNLEEHHHYRYRRENLKSQTNLVHNPNFQLSLKSILILSPIYSWVYQVVYSV